MKVKLMFIVYLFLLSTCTKVNLDEINNLNGNKIWVIGHGGEGFQTGRHPVPTNSETSIVKAIEYYNADGCEIDVQLSLDSVLILFHDEYLEQATHCLGCVNENTAQDLLGCRFKQDFTVNTMQNGKLIGLEKVFSMYCHSVFDPKFFIDLKLSNHCGQNSNDYYDAMAVSLTSLITEYNATDHVFISCSNSQLLKKIKALNPTLRLILNIGAGDFHSGLSVALDNGFYGVEIYNEYVSREQISEAHSNNLWVVIYGVKDRNTQIDAVKKSPDVIITDNILLLQQVLTY